MKIHLDKLLLTVLLSLTSSAVAAYGYMENVSPPANNVSQIIGDGNTVVFIDVPSNYWAKEQIDYFSQQGIINGYTDGSFKPEAGVTKEEFCKLLVSTFNQPLSTPTIPSFSDVPENRWSYPYIEVCKEFMTGYDNPLGGKPSFHPTEYATREDIAVALVRMMGFTDDDANNPNYAAYNFRDGGSISPKLMAYVSIACERGLISGYPDGTFGPMRGITRAETLVLLNRATKQAFTDINAELEMTASVLYSEDGKTATINVVAEEGTTVTVNGESVNVNYYNEWSKSYTLSEGENTFEVIATNEKGKQTKDSITINFKVGEPKIQFINCPESTKKNSITVKGKITGNNEGAMLFIDDDYTYSKS